MELERVCFNCSYFFMEVGVENLGVCMEDEAFLPFADEIFDSGNFDCCHELYKKKREFDRELNDLSVLYNWSPELEMALTNAGLDNPDYLEKRIAFCSEYIARSGDQSDSNLMLELNIRLEQEALLVDEDLLLPV